MTNSLPFGLDPELESDLDFLREEEIALEARRSARGWDTRETDAEVGGDEVGIIYRDMGLLRPRSDSTTGLWACHEARRGSR